MGVRIPAAFEDPTGTIARLTGEIELLTAATPGEVLTADNPASTATFQPAGGGSSVFAQYSGNNITVADGASGKLTFDTLNAGSAQPLLDITDPANPLIIAAGTYAITLTAESTAPLTSTGNAGLLLNVTPAVILTGQQAFGYIPPQQVGTVSAVVVTDAGGALTAFVSNNDGVSSRDFFLTECDLVKLS